MEDRNLQGRRALVCASSQGLGYAVAEALARGGAEIVLNSRDQGRLDAARNHLMSTLGDAAPRIEGFAADLTRSADIDRLWRQAAEGGPVDILVTNVGGPPPGTFDSFDDSAWQHAFDGLVLSVVRLWRHALPPMRERGWGRLVTITSSSAREPIDGLLLSTTMRAGIAGMVTTVAKEEAKHGITINNVCPNLTDTRRLNQLFKARADKEGKSPEEVRAAMIAGLPRGRLNDPVEFAEVVAFLASPAASGLSGHSLPIDAAAGRFVF